jgi:exonuclease III
VNGINGRLRNLLGWLDETAPDIVCLQELKAPDEKFPAAALRAAGYTTAVWYGQKSWNGVRNASGHPAVEPRGHEDLLSVPPGATPFTPMRRPNSAASSVTNGCEPLRQSGGD